MAIEQAPNVDLTYVAEVTRGTTPATPAMKKLRTISRNINLQKRILRSAEVSTHAQQVDVRHGFNSIDGAIGFEWSRTTYDDWLEAALRGTWAANVLKMGNTLKTFTVERRFTGLSLYEVYKGVTVNTAEIRITPEEIVGGTFNLLGMSDGTPSGTSLDAAPDAVTTTSPFDSFNGSISEGGGAIATVTGVTLNLNLNRQLSPVLMSKYSPDVFDGVSMLTGTMSAFFESHALLTKFRAETVSTLSIVLNDPDGVNTMTLLLPRIKYTGNNKDPQGTGGVIQEMPFEALYDSTEATCFKLTRSA